MSFLDDLFDVGSSVVDFLGSNNPVASLARTAITGFALNQVTKSIAKDNAVPAAAQTQNATTPDPGSRVQVDPDPNAAVPVVYGEAFLGGIVTDAVLSNDQKTMWFCMTLCEKTGNVFSTGIPSVISFREIWWDTFKINFDIDGITVASFVDEDGNINTDPAGLIKIYCFNGGSASPTVPYGYGNSSLQGAASLFPNWTANHTMDNLVFALIKIDYNKEKNVTGIGNVQFKLKNTITEPGDVLYDYMTNTLYGAGIPAGDIYA